MKVKIKPMMTTINLLKKKIKAFTILLVIVCLLLAYLHGSSKFEDKFTVDEITIYLLLIAIIPFIIKNIESFKFGDFEAKFKNAPIEDQIFIFLEGVANHGRLTFYEPRKDEKHLGDVLMGLSAEAKERDHSKFVKMLSKQLNSNNSDQIWFASEIIGHFQIKDLKFELKQIYSDLDEKDKWPVHKLNCLWAYSRFNDYQELQNFYLRTNEIKNLEWITEAYFQMPKHHKEDKDKIIKNLNEFTSQIQQKKITSNRLKNLLSRIDKYLNNQ